MNTRFIMRFVAIAATLVVSAEVYAGWFRSTLYDVDDAPRLQVSLVEKNDWRPNVIPALSTCHIDPELRKDWKHRYFPSFKVTGLPADTKYVVVALRGRLWRGGSDRWEVAQLRIAIDALTDGEMPVIPMVRKPNPPGVAILSKKGDGTSHDFCVRNLDGDHEFIAEVYAYRNDNPEAEKALAVGTLVLGTL